MKRRVLFLMVLCAIFFGAMYPRSAPEKERTASSSDKGAQSEGSAVTEIGHLAANEPMTAEGLLNASRSLGAYRLFNANEPSAAIEPFNESEHLEAIIPFNESEPSAAIEPFNESERLEENTPLGADVYSEYASYIISGEGSTLALSRYTDGVPTLISEGTLSELLSKLDGGRVVFDNAYASESVTLASGSFVFSGELSLSGTLTVPHGTSLELCDFKMNHSGLCASVRIKGGSLSVRESELISEQGSIVLDYSASSMLIFSSGRILSGGDYAIILNLGEAKLLGGEVNAEYGSAVFCDSSLILGETTLSGADFGVVTKRAIALSEGASAPIAKVQYLGELKDGTLTELFYNATEASAEQLLLFDFSGREYKLTYFEKYGELAEKNFLAVYLPFTVRYFLDGTLVRAEEKILSEPICPQVPTVAEGYKFVCWLFEGKEIGAGFEACGNHDLYAKVALIPPEISAEGFSADYDCDRHFLSVSVKHPLDEAGGRYSYEWYKDGVLVSGARELSVGSVSDSGDYKCKVTFYHKTQSVSVTVGGIYVSIKPAVVALPESVSKPYNGEAQLSGIKDNSYYTVSESKVTDAGRHSVTLTLSDRVNYVFENGQSTAEIFFEITPAVNEWKEPPSVKSIFVGQDPKITAVPLWGTPVYSFSTEKDGVYTENIPVFTGIYYVKITVAASENYTSLTSEPMAFEIFGERVVGLEVIKPPSKTEYSAFDEFSAAGIRLLATYNSGRAEEISADKLSVGYQSASSFRFGDNAVIVSYCGASLNLPVTVSKASYRIDGLPFSDTTLIYNGEYRTISPTLDLQIGGDGIPLKYKITGGGRDVGEYTVTLIFETDSTNYLIPESISATLEILPFEAELIWGASSFVYDNTPKVPEAYYLDVKGNKRAALILGAETNAGEGYVAKAEQTDKNYTFVNSSRTFSIAKASYDLGNLKWVGGGGIYSGDEQSVYITGLPEGITVLGYTNGTARDAGEYIAEAIFIYDERNYNKPEIAPYKWNVLKADYDMSSLVFESVVAVYDGNLHYPRLSGELPVGIDGSSPSYTFSSGARDVLDGEVRILISFISGSKNYNAPEEMIAYAKVTPKGISVLWSNTEQTYSARELLPEASSPYAQISLSGGGIDAGTYTVRAESCDPNYYVINAEITFTVKKAQNSFTEQPSIPDFYEGDEPKPIGKAFFGEVIFSFYSDPECRIPCDTPKAYGTYYAVCRVGESKNYLPLYSEPMKFEIIKVVPISIRAELLSKELFAMQTLSGEDLRVTVIYNNGRLAEISEGFDIIYENGGTLLKKDTIITVDYLGLTAEIPITVGKATYDMSNAIWLNTVVIYDGTSHFPLLSGLPDGVSVSSYTGEGAICAGNYTFGAILSYDEENYEMPIVPECELFVKKQTVEPPSVKALVYSGREQSFSFESKLYTVIKHSFKNAGIYTLFATLNDPENYEFKGGADECAFVAQILPAELEYRLPRVELYLFDELDILESEHISGTVYEGDTVPTMQKRVGNRVVLKSLNPNYKIKVIGGEITEYGYPSGDFVAKAAIIAVSILILALVLIFGVARRDRIFSAIKAKGTASISEVRLQGSGDQGYDLPVSGRGEDPKKENCDTKSKSQKISDEKNDTESEGDATKTQLGHSKNSKITLGESGEDEKNPEQSQAEETDIGENRTSGATEQEKFSKGAEDLGVNIDKADSLITDSLAKDLIKRGKETIVTEGRGQGIINVDTLSKSFRSGDRVDVNILKEKNLIPYDTAYLKVLARGAIDKPLRVFANDFSLSAVKMLALTGGEAIKVNTVIKKRGGE